MRRQISATQADRWEPWPRPTVRDSGGPVRVVFDQPNPDHVSRPVGLPAPVWWVPRLFGPVLGPLSPNQPKETPDGNQ